MTNIRKRILGRRLVTRVEDLKDDDLMYDDVTGLLSVKYGCVRVVRGSKRVERLEIVTLFLDDNGRVKDLHWN